jgi:hypothetical protein
MTDRSNDIDPAERIRQLQARRAASGRSQRAVAVASTAPADALAPAGVCARRSEPGPRTPKQRRRHPAAATRWLLGGLSIASFFGIAGTVAAANVSSVATPAATAVTASAPATNALGTVAQAAATPVTSKATHAASASTSTARVAHTTTGGS